MGPEKYRNEHILHVFCIVQEGYELLYFLSVELKCTGENTAWWALELACLGSDPSSTSHSQCDSGQVTQMGMIAAPRPGLLGGLNMIGPTAWPS